METILSLCIGIGLSAACGFRVFVPLLITSIAAYSGHLDLASSFDWVGTPPALIAFSVATLLEVGAYYIPWLDNLMDSVTTPAAIVAGTMVTASMITEMSPFMKWTLAVVAGGGAAGIVQASTVLTRATSSATSGGMLNPIFATVELGGSIVGSLLALWLPLVALILLVAMAVVLFRKVLPRFRSAPKAQIQA